MSTSPDVVKGSSLSRPGLWLREHRLRVTLITAFVEGLLVLVGVISWWLVVALAIVAVGFWGVAGRNYKSGTGRQVSWIFASSQAVVVLVPILFRFVTFGATVAVVDPRDRSPLLSFPRAQVTPPCDAWTVRVSRYGAYTRPAVGRSQVVRQRVLVPRSQVRILAPQPSTHS